MSFTGAGTQILMCRYVDTTSKCVAIYFVHNVSTLLGARLRVVRIGA